MQQEKDYIKRLQTEMEQERKLQQEKRKQEREYLHKMMIENEKNKARMKEDELRQKDEDAKAQDEYARMLQKQEDDRNAEMSKREARAQEFMNKMAGNVLEKMEKKQKVINSLPPLSRGLLQGHEKGHTYLCNFFDASRKGG